MKLLLYADLQATDGSEVRYLDPSERLQDWRVRRFFEVLREIYDANGCEGLIDLGDTTDDRSAIPVPTIDALISNLDTFDGWNIKLIGNHEQYTKDARVHVGRLFQHRFTIVDDVQVFKSPDSDAVFVFAAYPGDYKALADRLQEIAIQYRGKKLVLFGHFEVIGSQLNSGVALHGVPREVLGSFKVGFLGHIHKPQAVGKNIYYVGSPFQQNFGESGEQKRVAIFDTQTLEMEWVSLEGYGFPVYRTVTAQEFVDLVKEDSEDRFHVVLSSQADTELLFAHPLCNRAETEYSYTITNSTESVQAKSWSFESVLARFLEKNPPSNAGIELPVEEMLGIGVEIAQGAN
jgi:DNA repair exonuclease SbcCD nuclease subunit